GRAGCWGRRGAGRRGCAWGARRAARGAAGSVARARETYRRKREILLGALERRGFRVAGSRAGMYLWVEMSGELVPRLLEHGVVVSPGEFFGPSGAGYVRFALVPTEAECRRAAEILEEVL